VPVDARATKEQVLNPVVERLAIRDHALHADVVLVCVIICFAGWAPCLLDGCQGLGQGRSREK
jgi:hypothetical protein